MREEQNTERFSVALLQQIEKLRFKEALCLCAGTAETHGEGGWMIGWMDGETGMCLRADYGDLKMKSHWTIRVKIGKILSVCRMFCSIVDQLCFSDQTQVLVVTLGNFQDVCTFLLFVNGLKQMQNFHPETLSLRQRSPPPPPLFSLLSFFLYFF